MQKCMELIRNPEATDAQLQSVLRLLSTFLKKVSNETLQYDPQVSIFSPSTIYPWSQTRTFKMTETDFIAFYSLFHRKAS